jgi:hypothetical protein
LTGFQVTVAGGTLLRGVTQVRSKFVYRRTVWGVLEGDTISHTAREREGGRRREKRRETSGEGGEGRRGGVGKSVEGGKAELK